MLWLRTGAKGGQATASFAVRDTETPLQEGREAVRRGDAAAAQHAYQMLKGSAATFGLADLAQKAHAIEQPARSGQLPGAQQVARLEAGYRKAAAELSAWTARVKPA